MTAGMQKKVFISALEPSAEGHCANLIAAVARKARVQNPQPQIQWTGFGGSRMQALGCTLLEDPTADAAMLYNVLGRLGHYRRMIKTASQWIAENSPDLVIICDSPAFNFHIAKAARRRGIPVLFYVAPQLWAWAPWRIHKLRRCCTRLAAILPFEEEWFRSRGIAADFVGNPLFDDISADPDQCRKSYADYNPAAPRIALLPGSRQAELTTLWPAMLDTAMKILAARQGAKFFAAAPDENKLDSLRRTCPKNLPVEFQIGEVFDLCRRSDLTLIASGSATLQAAAAGCPMVVMYQSSRLMWHLVGRWIIRTRYLSLVNILARRPLVPELMPYLPQPEKIVSACSDLLDDKAALARISSELVDLTLPLRKTRADDTAAEIVLQMLA